MPQHVGYVRFAHRPRATKIYAIAPEIDLYAVEGSSFARASAEGEGERQINVPDATSTAETKITSAINDVIDFADCRIST